MGEPAAGDSYQESSRLTLLVVRSTPHESCPGLQGTISVGPRSSRAGHDIAGTAVRSCRVPLGPPASCRHSAVRRTALPSLMGTQEPSEHLLARYNSPRSRLAAELSSFRRPRIQIMKLKSVVLLSASLGIGVIGLGYLISPQFMYGLYGIEIETVNEANMVRSAYGGLFLGFGILFLMGARRDQFSRPALIALLTFMASFAVGRIVSIVVDGMPAPLILSLIVFEIVYSALAAYLLSAE